MVVNSEDKVKFLRSVKYHPKRRSIIRKYLLRTNDPFYDIMELYFVVEGLDRGFLDLNKQPQIESRHPMKSTDKNNDLIHSGTTHIPVGK